MSKWIDTGDGSSFWLQVCPGVSAVVTREHLGKQDAWRTKVYADAAPGRRSASAEGEVVTFAFGKSGPALRRAKRYAQALATGVCRVR